MALRALLLAVLALASATAAFGQHDATVDAQTGERMLAALDDSVWIADGPASDRHVYVLFGTTCSWCRSLYQASRSRSDEVQLRWVVLGGAGEGAEAVLDHGSIEAIGRIFDGESLPVTDGAAASRALDVNLWLQHVLGSGLVFPTFVYPSDNGVQIARGMRGELAPLLADVVARPGKADHASSGTRLAKAPAPERQPARFQRLVHFGQQPLPIHVLPDGESLRIGELEPLGTYDLVLAFVADAWIEVAGLRSAEGGGRTLPAFVHAPQLIALSRLEFTVTAAEGAVVASEMALPIHTHPSLDSPVLDELSVGYQMERAGEVVLDGVTWDAIVFFRDGGHAYVPRPQ